MRVALVDLWCVVIVILSCPIPTVSGHGSTSSIGISSVLVRRRATFFLKNREHKRERTHHFFSWCGLLLPPLAGSYLLMDRYHTTIDSPCLPYLTRVEEGGWSRQLAFVLYYLDRCRL